jgi:uncharacterized protein YjbJ (UPF0337 family)
MAMSDVPENEIEDTKEESEKGKLSGFSQFIVGEMETIGGVLTGDPLTQAEGEFNVEVGTVREDIEEDLEDTEDDSK